MVVEKIFWERSWPHPIFGELGMNSERLFRRGNIVTIIVADFDGEDQRTYIYQGVISAEEFRKLLNQAIEKGNSSIGQEGRGEWRWSFNYDPDTRKVTMAIFGCGGGSPGGIPVFSTNTIGPIEIDDLLEMMRYHIECSFLFYDYDDDACDTIASLIIVDAKSEREAKLEAEKKFCEKHNPDDYEDPSEVNSKIIKVEELPQG